MSEDIMFCADHRCSLNDCYFERCVIRLTDVMTKYCSKHACIKCVVSGSSTINCGKPNACADHQCVEFECTQLQIVSPSSRYCIKHVCIECVANAPSTDKLGNIS